MKAGELPRRFWLGLALIVVPFALLIGLEAYDLGVRIPDFAESRRQVAHTFDVLLTAQALDHAIEDAERGQRDYLLTGNPVDLESYRTAARDAPGLLAKLEALTADNADQQRRWRGLSAQLDAKLADLQRSIQVRDREGLDAARRVIETDVGLQTTRAIANSIAAAVNAENALLVERQARALAEERSLANRALVIAGIAFAAMVTGLVLAVLAFANIRRAERAHALAERRFRLLVEGAADHAIYMLDPKGHIIEWNAGAERLKGYGEEEIIGQHFSRFYTEADRQADIPRLALDTAEREGKFEAEGWRVRKDGSRFWASVAISPLRDAAGHLLGFSKITRDVTERREHELALEQARAAVVQSQKMDSLGQLSGGIAHDFNNLLHVIINGIEILDRRLKRVDADDRDVLDMVKRNALRAASLTQRILAFARRQPLQPRPVDLNKLVAGMNDLLQRALGESVELETALGGGTWTVSVDANQLEAAILNLAVNARDAMPRGGKLTIETTNAFLDDAYAAAHAEVKPGQYAMIAVSDTGVGMTEDVAAKAFDPFFTTKEPGQGTGLGLSQVYGFVKQSGGHVKIYSEPGEGTTVKLYLPRGAGAPQDASREAPAAPIGAGKDTILVVEDDEDVLRFTAEVLRELGFRVLTVRDARDALRALDEQASVDLVFTDVGLPGGMNGRALADEILRRRPCVKVLFTTGYARNAIVHHGRLDPGVHLLVKPYTQSALAQKVKQVLDERG